MISGPLNILLVGGGGREHALAWKLKQSGRCGTLYSTGTDNPGIAALATAVDIPFDIKNAFRVQRWCVQHRIGMAVIGPEEPLCQGIVDILTGVDKESGLGGAVPAVFGPVKDAARLEGDKAFAKEVMRAAQVPTADARAFSDYEGAKRYLESRTEPHVIKAAGLAKGKGVFVPSSQEEGLAALDRVMVAREFGAAGDSVVIEERLKGREVSVFALVDGRTIYVLEACQDHKRLLNGAKGPNTGGMGALCPTPALDEKMLDTIQRDILVPTIDALKRQGIEYRGVLYAGLMLTPAGPKVLEFNVRFGDPECQALMMRLDTDLVELMLAVCEGRLDEVDLRWKPGASVCVVMASEGYPDKPRAGVPIEGITQAEQLEGVQVFQAGTKQDGLGRIVTTGGRVLGVTASGADVGEARAQAYRAVERIKFAGGQYRTDIGTEVVG